MDKLLEEQQEYYNQRSGEYDDWWNRKGDFDHGEQSNTEFTSNRSGIYSFLETVTGESVMGPGQLRVLELAPGTGNFTHFFLRNTPKRFNLRCEEGSPDMMRVLGNKYAELVAAAGDAFQIHQTNLLNEQFAPEKEHYDIVFLGFFISHVPPELFASFFGKIFAALKPGGRIIFADSFFPLRNKMVNQDAHEAVVNRVEYQQQQSNDYVIERKLLNGDKFRIVKVGFSVDDIISILQPHGFVMTHGDGCSVNSTFIYGSFSKPTTIAQSN
ncbi:hypothetical protein SAMD00019534_032410 [Acytostelium subglobosum LB1]|uniref:hypothetical protein n=1 Tax=Acytostelium subglobosum LB1 TaxID=1410327 RepID=UPI000644D4D2|nr:hypothetical protein SAMD00019534_032410 [Acytostelium subglobosum LB1]GAM20066.1 hypothetical protein SAMD00019534_032410 [Acytostelium subglobosum LB1]|eukprot:XP_012756828.1 hypothetical protein SAMD00019534_032410 [Acytostelium subglobosum LB1]